MYNSRRCEIAPHIGTLRTAEGVYSVGSSRDVAGFWLIFLSSCRGDGFSDADLACLTVRGQDNGGIQTRSEIEMEVDNDNTAATNPLASHWHIT